jgi:ferric-dicitrate binding protein FerR (iron transport regulator)
MRAVLQVATVGVFALLSSAGLAAGQVVGMVTGLVGSASVERAGGAAPTPLALRSEVHEGDTVRTGPGARLRIALRDQSVLSLGADGELKLDRLARVSQSPAAGSLLSLAIGYLRAVIGRLQPDSVFQIRSPSMVAAVRGTDWIESYAAGKTELFVAAGQVLTTDPVDPTNWALLRAGEGVTFMTGAWHTPVIRWGQQKINRFVEATRVP